MDLTSKQRQALKALAHHLEPVVQVGTAGVTEGVIEKTSVELENHELIKVRVAKDAPVGLKEAAEELAKATGAAVAQTIGRIAVLYRRRKENPTIVLPKTP